MMKYTVTVEDRTFEVEVGDLNSRPIVAVVDGETFEVWPEDDQPTQPVLAAPIKAQSAPRPTAAPAKPSANGLNPGADGLKAVHAPIPGVIISVAVEPGASVTVGQELCVLEAMKMKNSIRATRAGQIAAVNVSPGQQVKHHEVLVEYAE